MSRRDRITQSRTQLYILGLLYFDDDTEKTVVLSRNELAAIGWMFVSSVFGDSRPDVGDDDTYFKFRLSAHENPFAFRAFLGEQLSQVVDEVQFGYYHHRAIFRFTFAQATKLHVIRNARHEAYQVTRTKCFDRFTEQHLPINAIDQERDQTSKLIRYIYSYCLMRIPRGKTAVNAERANIRIQDYDHIYTSRSTTFGLTLTEYTSILSPLRHFVRISVPSTIVYVDGKTIRPDLFDNIVDAIYYGGLYEKVKFDRRKALEHGSSFVPCDTWTNDMLLKCLDILSSFVSSKEVTEISVHLKRLSLLVALFAVFLSLAIKWLFK
ncbi:MAG TPA: hypothetical protein VHX14_25130 [Thermoanaerobaculia bacterium]|jgi:hypothetical protein|nr:hypothetical protein [Thermoanaerobaculia bacterium]